MHIARIYLPLSDNDGNRFAERNFAAVEEELSRRFGGVTSHMEAPATGLWRQADKMHQDDIVIFEVILQEPDRDWWRAYRMHLEREFRQLRILIMLQQIELI
jgi:hypothetical protein